MILSASLKTSALPYLALSPVRGSAAAQMFPLVFSAIIVIAITFIGIAGLVGGGDM